MIVAILLVVGALLAVLAIVLIPRSGRPDDGPLPPDLETRLLLGERPEDEAETTVEPADLAGAPEPPVE